MTPKEIRALFSRYMKVKDPKKAHAVLSASGSERWLGCPASVQLSIGQPNVDNEHGIAGTNAHTLLQFILENDNWRKLLKLPEAKAFKEFIDYSEDQHTAVMLAYDYVLIQKTKIWMATGVVPEMYIEQKVKLDGVGFGTSDVMLYQPFGLLHIMDYKNGKYKVEPENNTQGLYYGVAAADLFGWDYREIWITIIQPNAPHKDGPIRTWKTTPERIEKAKLMFTRGAKRTKEANPAIVPNHKYCWFCPARPVCPAQMEVKSKKLIERFTR